MIAFADASAVVKLYSDEPGSEVVRREEQLIVAAITRVEVAAAIWRKQRMDELSATDARLLVDAFLADWAGAGAGSPTFVPVAATASVLDAAMSLSGVHGLRAYDSVQLASALAARAAAGEVAALLCFDAALTRAAAAEGFAVNRIPDGPGRTGMM